MGYNQKAQAERLRKLAPKAPPKPRPVKSDLPSVGSGALLARFGIYTPRATDQAPTIVRLSCWRARIYVPNIGAAVNINGAEVQGVNQQSVNPATAYTLIELGGAYYRGRPVYINQALEVTTTDKADILVIEEYFDGYASAGN